MSEVYTLETGYRYDGLSLMSVYLSQNLADAAFHDACSERRDEAVQSAVDRNFDDTVASSYIPSVVITHMKYDTHSVKLWALDDDKLVMLSTWHEVI